MKGEVQKDHMPDNKYQYLVLGLLPLTVVEMSGIEDELNKTELPDQTIASGGSRKPTEFTISIPLHHREEQAAMEAWYREAQDPVSPSYKKIGTLLNKSLSGTKVASWSTAGVFPWKRATGELKMGGEGAMLVVEWSLSADEIVPI